MFASTKALAPTLALMLAGASGSAHAATPHDIYLIVWDATRADHLSPYGYQRDTTPNLASLAKTSTVFTNAQASGSWTIPSVASLYTGLFGYNHKVDFAPTKGIVDIPMEATTLAETLHEQGYYTALFSSQSVYNEPGYMQGFDTHAIVGSGEFPDRITKVMEDAGDRPVFMVLYWLNPHSPYRPPKLHDLFSDPNGPQVNIVLNEEGKKNPGDYPHDDVNSGRVVLDDAQWAQLGALYDGELHSDDQRMQNCLDRITHARSLDDAVVVMTADHGEMFNDRPQQRTWHGWPSHENQRVPLIVRAPGQTVHAEVTSQVRGIDVYPTVLELAGAKLDHPVNGESLASLMAGGSAPARPNVGASHYWDGLLYYNSGAYNLITSRSAPEKTFVYDLAADPDERTNLAASQPQLVVKLQAELEDFMEKTTIDLGVAGEAELSDEDTERLRALGYIE